MSRRLEIAVCWAYWSEDVADSFVTSHIVTKKEGKFYIVPNGQGGPSSNGVDVNVMNKWIDHEDRLHPHYDLAEIHLKLIDGEKVISSAIDPHDWRQTVIYLMNLL